MRRIVFSISFFRQVLPVQLVFTSTKSRRKFYTQVERQSFHTASTRRRHRALSVHRFGVADCYPAPFKFDDILMRILAPFHPVLVSPDASRPPRISIDLLFVEHQIVQSRPANSAPLRALLGRLPNRHLPVALF